MIDIRPRQICAAIHSRVIWRTLHKHGGRKVTGTGICLWVLASKRKVISLELRVIEISTSSRARNVSLAKTWKITHHLAPKRLNFRIPGHNCVTLMFCSRSPAVSKYLHMIHLNIPMSRVRDCGTAGALVLYPCNISFCLSSAGVQDCGSTSSIPTPSNLFISKCFLSHFFFLISWLTSWLQEQKINVTQSWPGVLTSGRYFNVTQRTNLEIQTRSITK